MYTVAPHRHSVCSQSTDRHEEGVDKYGSGSELHAMSHQRPSQDGGGVGRKCKLNTQRLTTHESSSTMNIAFSYYI